jgi:hypothetical protein
MGVGFSEFWVILLLLLAIGAFIYWLTRKLLRKALKDASDRKIKLLSGLIAFLLSPVIVIGSLALIIYLSVENTSIESEEDIARNHYEAMEYEIKEDLKIGMSKSEVVALFGPTDTTQSALIYDFSLPEAEEKYVLELNFDKGKLNDFKRQQ